MAARQETLSLGELQERLDGIQGSRKSLGVVFETIGTPNYQGKGGQKLSLDGLSGESRIDAALGVGVIKQRIKESILPALDLKQQETERQIITIKIERMRPLVEAGYIDPKELEEAQALLGIDNSRPEIKTRQTSALGEKKKPESQKPPEKIQAAQPKAITAELTQEEREDLSDIDVDKEHRLVSIDGRQIIFDNKNDKFSWPLFLHMLSGQEFHRTTLEEFLKGLGSINPNISQYIFQLKKKIEVNYKYPKVLKSRGHGTGGSFYRIYGNVRFVSDLDSSRDTSSSATDTDNSTIRFSPIDAGQASEVLRASRQRDTTGKKGEDRGQNKDEFDPSASPINKAPLSTDSNNGQVPQPIPNRTIHSGAPPRDPQEEWENARETRLAGFEMALESDIAVFLLSRLAADARGTLVGTNKDAFALTLGFFQDTNEQDPNGNKYTKTDVLKHATKQQDLASFGQYVVNALTAALEKYWSVSNGIRLEGRGATINGFCEELKHKNITLPEIIYAVADFFHAKVPREYANWQRNSKPRIALHAIGGEDRREPSHGKMKL